MQNRRPRRLGTPDPKRLDRYERAVVGALYSSRRQPASAERIARRTGLTLTQVCGTLGRLARPERAAELGQGGPVVVWYEATDGDARYTLSDEWVRTHYTGAPGANRSGRAVTALGTASLHEQEGQAEAASGAAPAPPFHNTARRGQVSPGGGR